MPAGGYSRIPERSGESGKGLKDLKQQQTSKALCSSRVPFFIVEKSVVMVYNKLLNFAGCLAQ